ncbi:MAG: hypothetical protein H6668_13430 [Ardenticatenaceae bacterium]|nr:hypothetical protein [Ardenticatenaceae bacterium]
MQSLVTLFAIIAILLWLAFVGYGVVAAIVSLQQRRDGLIAFLLYMLVGGLVVGSILLGVWVVRAFF